MRHTNQQRINEIMSKYKSLILLPILIALIFSNYDNLSAQNNVSEVKGRVINGTQNGEPIAGALVTLHLEGPARHDHLETSTTEDGYFYFTDVPVENNLTYGVSVVHQGALYGTDFDILQNQSEAHIIRVYESKPNQGLLDVETASILFSFADKASETVSVLEIIQIRNSGPYTYVPSGNGPMDLLRFGLPNGTTGLELDTQLIGADIIQVDKGFAILSPISPGIYNIMYTYHFPYENTNYVFERTLRLGAQHLRILSPKSTLSLSTDRQGTTNPIKIGTTDYNLIEFTNLPPGHKISILLSDLPESTLTDQLKQHISNIRWEFLAPIVLVVLFLSVIYMAVTQKGLSRLQLRQKSNTLSDEERLLMRLLSDLDKLVDSGDLTRRGYNQRRRIIEEKLSQLRDD